MFKHFGLTGQKFGFVIEVKNVVLPEMWESFDGTESLCVGYERKGRPTVYTSDRNVLLNDQDDITAEFNEKITMSATMYKDNRTNIYKEKFGSLLILQRKKGSAGQRTNKEAFKTIGVASVPLHEVVQGGREFTLKLGWCVSEKAFLHLVVTCQEREGGADTTVGTGDTNSLMTGDDDESVASASMSNQGQGNHGGRLPQPPLPTTAARGGGAPPLFPPPVPVPLGSSTSSASGDVRRLQQRVTELEAALLASADVVDYERNKAKEAAIKAARLEQELESLQQQGMGGRQQQQSSQQIAAMKQELTSLRDELQAAREALATAQVTGGQETARYRLAAAEGQEQVERLQEEKGRVERALWEKNDEAEQLLSELIQAKMTVGDLNTELDEVKRALKLLRQQTGVKGPALQLNTRTSGYAAASGIASATPLPPSSSNPGPGSGPSRSYNNANPNSPTSRGFNGSNNNNNNGSGNNAAYASTRQQQSQPSQQTPQPSAQGPYSSSRGSVADYATPVRQQQQQPSRGGGGSAVGYGGGNSNTGYNGMNNNNNYGNNSNENYNTQPSYTASRPGAGMMRGFGGGNDSGGNNNNNNNNINNNNNNNSNNGYGSSAGSRSSNPGNSRAPPQRPVF